MLNIKKFLQTTLLLTVLSSTVSYAKEVTFTLHAPENFNKRVEVYLNKSPHPMAAGSTTMTLDLKEKSYDVFVMSSEDIAHKYEFSYAETLDVSTTDNFDINISSNYSENPRRESLMETTTTEVESETATENKSESLETSEVPTESESKSTEETTSNSNIEGDAPEEVEPSYYDFSEEGKPSATLYVSAAYYSCFDTVTYQFVGNHVYEIQLTRDHDFNAYVKLPVGKYYETETVNPKLDEEANEGHMTFIWVHGDNEQDCRNYYTLNENDNIEVKDLKIYMVEPNGDASEVDSQLLFSEKRLENYLKAVNNNVDKKLQEQFPKEEHKEPVIATAKPKKEENTTNKYMYIAIGAISLIIAGTVVLFIKKKSEED